MKVSDLYLWSFDRKERAAYMLEAINNAFIYIKYKIDYASDLKLCVWCSRSQSLFISSEDIHTITFLN